MKSIKVIMVSALSVMTLAATAAPTAVAKISVASASGNGNDAVILVESDECSADIETATGKDIVKVMNDANDYSINLYAVSKGTNLSAIGTNDLSDVALTFVSNKTETDYTLTFSNVTGTIKLYDAVEDQEITLANAGTYSFTVAANSTIADRFIINRSAPAVPGICNNYDKLQITGYAGAQLEVLNYADKASVFTETVAGDNVEIDLEAKGLTANTQYFVKLTPAGATVALEYVIKYKPAVTVVP